VLIADAELAGQVLSAPDVYKFPKSPFYKIVGDALLGNGLVTSGGELWRSHRHIVTPLFHFKSLKSMVEMMILYTNDLVEDLQENGAKEYRPLHSVLSKFTLAQIVYLAFGGAMDIDWMHERQCAIGELYTKYLGQRVFFGPAVRFVPFTPGWKLYTYRREVENMMRNIIVQARRDGASQKKSDTDMTEGVNLINTMINAKDPATGKPVSDQEIVEECCTVLFAGFDTTAGTLISHSTALTLSF
jgi:cytochrome P450